MAKDYYSILGVSKTANADEIKKAYRNLAKKYHPDANQGNDEAEKKFKEISEAYEILKDEQKRAAYDRYGHEAFTNGANRGGFSGGSNEGFDFSDIFGDIFGDFMGGGASSQRASARNEMRGSDLRYNIQVDLEEAYKGKQEQIRFTSLVPCSNCSSTGSEGGASGVTSCSTCRGSGRTRMQQGFFAVERTCSTCHGTGQVIKNPCKSCHGQGRVRKEKTLSVNIPAGVEDGTRIRLAGEGEAGLRGASSGDLYIFINVKEHPFFKVSGTDIHCKITIKMLIAALGGSIEVPTIDKGKAKVTISAGTQTGDRFRLKGKGMSKIKSKNYGDMYIHITVETPTNLTAKQKELLTQFDEAGQNHSPESESVFKKFKDMWGK